MRLIDADKLIKTYEKETGYTWSAKEILECPKCFIDDAPTEPQVTVFAENASKEEIEDFKQELENVLVRPQSEIFPMEIVAGKCPLDANGDCPLRPQGEWEESHIFSCGKILRMQLDVIEHKCKNCGRWSIKWATTIPDNFCSYCGASIKEVKKND